MAQPPKGLKCDEYCKGEGPGNEVFCDNFKGTTKFTECAQACMECHGSNEKPCYCPTLLSGTSSTTDGSTGPIVGTPPPQPPQPPPPGPVFPPNPTEPTSTTTEEDGGDNGGNGGPYTEGGPDGGGEITDEPDPEYLTTEPPLIGNKQSPDVDKDSDILVYVIIAFVILVILILCCLCCYWWSLKNKKKDTDRSAYESVTPASQARPVAMSPYVGYDYPKREKRRHRHHRRRRDEEEGMQEDEEEEAPKTKAGKEGVLAQEAAAPAAVDVCADDEEECWECEEDDDDDDGGSNTYTQYQMCM